ncbi:unnamed protein product [Effrenium voratum]|nr:unnamed protein product [Effrenium voratum]
MAAARSRPPWRLKLRGLDGTELCLQAAPEMLGRELLRLARSQLPAKPGGVLHLSFGDAQVVPNKTLQQLGLDKIDSSGCFTYTRVNLLDAWLALQGFKVNAEALEGVTELSFNREFRRPLQGLTFPGSLRNLTFSVEFNQRLQGVDLPESLQSLTFGHCFNQPLDGVTLPKFLRSLTFGETFDQCLQAVELPRSLQSLKFGESFSQSLHDLSLPKSLESLTLGGRFNDRLHDAWPDRFHWLSSIPWLGRSLLGVSLPSNLKSLTFGVEFNQSLQGVTLPGSLQSLTFGFFFNQSLLGVDLPNALQSLAFGVEFNQSLQGVSWPQSLVRLTLGFAFNQSLEGVALPRSLESLTFGDSFNQSLHIVDLPSLRSLTFGDSFSRSLNNLPVPSLESLSLGAKCNQKLKGVTLPSLQSLTLGSEFIQFRGVAWPCLQSLTLGDAFNQSLSGMALPSSLRFLTFGFAFNQKLRGVALPSGLQSLTLGSRFDQSLQEVQFPTTLQRLSFGDSFNKPLQGVAFPNSLQSLTFGWKFNRSLEGVKLPGSLQSLVFGGRFNQSLQGLILPSSLRTLTLGQHFNNSLQDISWPPELQNLTLGKFFNYMTQMQLPNSLQSLTIGSYTGTAQQLTLPGNLLLLRIAAFTVSAEARMLPLAAVVLALGAAFIAPQATPTSALGARSARSAPQAAKASSLTGSSVGLGLAAVSVGLALARSYKTLMLDSDWLRRGVRMAKGLPVRFQRSKTNNRSSDVNLPGAMSSLEQPRQMHKHKTTSERLLISVRSKLGEALEVNGVPQAASELIQEAEALLRKGEQHLAKPRLASISGEDIFQGADEHARRYLLQTFTELDLGAAAGHQATSPMRRSQVLSNVSIDIPPDGSVISPSSPKTVAQQALHAFSVQEALHKAGAFDFDAIAFAALPEVQGQPITLLGNYMLSSSGYISLLQETGWLSQGDFEGRLTRFLTEIDRRYRPEAIYHSSAHATDVMATICWFLRLPYFSERSSILDYTLSVIAGAVHDVGHPGFNNDFQKTTFSDLALRYNDKSVLENFHEKDKEKATFDDLFRKPPPHRFHKTCIITWMVASPVLERSESERAIRCPLCREELKVDSAGQGTRRDVLGLSMQELTVVDRLLEDVRMVVSRQSLGSEQGAGAAREAEVRTLMLEDRVAELRAALRSLAPRG